MIESIKACRICSSNKLTEVLDLGVVPLANALRKEEDLSRSEARFPLRVLFCDSCKVLQLGETVPPEALFRDYVYFSSFSDEAVKNAENIATRMISDKKLGKDSLAVEIASNDGYLLKHYKNRGVPVLGIEPAVNVAEAAAKEHGIKSITEFFNSALADRLFKQGIRADVIHANNVLAHVPAVVDFAKGIRTLLKEDGVAVIEAPYVYHLIEKIEFDTIYHEHFYYYSLLSLTALFERAGLKLFDVEQIPIHGGSLRIFVGKDRTPTVRVTELLAFERHKGMDSLGYYESFSKRVLELKTDLFKLLEKLKLEHKSISAYGASAKGSTLMNFFMIGSNILDAVYDRSSVKAGLYTPGNHLKIKPADEILNDMPDYLLLLVWNFKDEIISQQQEYISRGGRFIVPLPTPQII